MLEVGVCGVGGWLALTGLGLQDLGLNQAFRQRRVLEIYVFVFKGLGV